MHRLIDAAQGGPVSWDTAHTLSAQARAKAKQSAQDEASEPLTLSTMRETNVTIAFLQQTTAFAKWWALAEAKYPIGLSQRFLHTFGAKRQPPALRNQGFYEEIALPVFEQLVLRVLKRFGSMGHFSLECDNGVLKPEVGIDALWHEARNVIFDAAQHDRIPPTVDSGTQKLTYWMQCTTLVHAVLEWTWTTHDTDAGVTLPALHRQNFFACTEFLWSRYLFGLAVLARDVREETWTKIDNPPTDKQNGNILLMQTILRQCVISPITVEMAPIHVGSLRYMADCTSPQYQTSLSRFRSAIHGLADLGSGKVSVDDNFGQP